MELPEARFTRLLKENNLTIILSRPNVKYIENGGIIIDQPVAQISFTDPSKEITIPAKEEVVNEPTTEALGSETSTE